MPAQPAVLITGGEGDLAAALRAEFVSAGWNVLAPGRGELDVTNTAQAARYFSSLTKLDLLVNNAGIRRDALLATQMMEDRDEVFDVCLRGAFLCSRAAAGLMQAQGSGHIVNIGSYSALSGPAGQTAYAAAKAGLIGLTQSMASELGPHGIRVNCVLPGWLETKFAKGVPEEVTRRVLAEHALGKFNTPVDAARFIAFLHTITAVSGQVFQLDSRISRSL
ncbi:MAG TPA: SDR family oxidoreductase [Verrucomicrobiales bacterium]|nr:SDR family oxidoreductase [Verrucomicrobiales bacterium]